MLNKHQRRQRNAQGECCPLVLFSAQNILYTKCKASDIRISSHEEGCGVHTAEARVVSRALV